MFLILLLNTVRWKKILLLFITRIPNFPKYSMKRDCLHMWVMLVISFNLWCSLCLVISFSGAIFLPLHSRLFSFFCHLCHVLFSFCFSFFFLFFSWNQGLAIRNYKLVIVVVSKQWLNLLLLIVIVIVIVIFFVNLELTLLIVNCYFLN